MKKITLIAVSIILAAQALYSQIKTVERSDYWNMAYTGGALVNLVDNVDSDNKSLAGYKAGFELFYKMNNKKSAVDISISYGRNNGNNSIPLSDNFKSFTEYYEITFGPRFYLWEKYFVETTFGNYILNYVSGIYEPIGNEHNSSLLKRGAFMCFGVGAGAGSQFRLSGDMDAIIKGNINFIVPGENMILLGGLNAGIVFNNRKIEPNFEKQYSKHGTWSVTVSGGINNPELFRSEEYTIGGNIGIEGAYRSSTTFEVYGNLDYNEIKRDIYYSSGRSMIDLTFGPRFIFGSEKYSSFFELGTGLYMQDYLNSYYSNDNVPHLGLNFGTGVIISVNEDIGFPLKGKINLVFGNNPPQGFLTATGGLRYII